MDINPSSFIRFSRKTLLQLLFSPHTLQNVAAQIPKRGLRTLPGNRLFPNFIIFLLICMFLAIQTGQTQTLDIRTFNVEDGLAQSQVQTILQDRDGFLWFGTTDGVSRFDGREFVKYTVRDGLQGKIITAVLPEKNGDIWFGTSNGKVTVYDIASKSFKPLLLQTRSRTFANSRIQAMLRDRHGIYWVATRDSGIFRYDGKSVQRFCEPQGLPDHRVYSIAETKYGDIWFGTARGIAILHNKADRSITFDSLTVKDGLPGKIITALLEDRLGTIWIGTRNGGLARYIPAYLNKGKSLIQTFSAAEGFNQNWVSTIFQDRDGSIWIGTVGGGVAKYEENKNAFPQKGHFHFITTQNGLSRNFILSIFQDNEGNFWFGTNGGGVCRYRDNSYKIFSTKDGLIDDVVWSITEDKQGYMWIGTDRGLTRFNPFKLGHTMQNSQLQQIFLNFPIRFAYDVFEAPDGFMWVLSYGKGIYKIDPNRNKIVEFIANRDGFNSTSAISIAMDREGYYWIATITDGVYKYNPKTGKFFHYTTENGLSDNTVFVIFRDSKNGLWLGTEKHGLLKIEGEKFKEFSTFTGYNIPSATSISEDSNGNLWIVTYDGELITFDGKRSHNISTLKDVGDETFYSVIVDDQNNIWLGSLRGIASFNPMDSTLTRFGKLRDFPLLETNQNAIYKDHNGNLWFGTIKGVLEFSPWNVKTNTIPPPVYITRLRIFLQDAPMQIDKPFPHDRNHLTFHFRGISFSAPSAVMYQYKLEGFDTRWSPPTREDFATYSNLPPGQYSFKVRARNSDGVWSSIPAVYRFEILAPFWQKWWFYTLLAAFVLGSAYITYKRRVYKIERDKSRLEEKVRLRTRALEEEKDKLRMAYEALMESEEKFRALTDTAAAAIFIYQGNQFRHVNPATVEITGYTPQELLNMNFWDVVHPEFRELVRSRGFERQNGKDMPDRYEFKIVTKSGEDRWIDFSARSIKYEGKPAAIGVALEITERKAMEENLRRLFRAVETTPMAIVLINTSGEIDYVNPGFLKMYEIDDSEKVLGLPMEQLLEPDSKSAFRKQVFPQLQKGKDWDGELIIRRLDGTIFPAEIIASIVKDENGNASQYLLHLQNIEVRKRNEKILRESEASYRELFNSIPDAIYIQDDAGRFLDVNEGAVQMYGYSKEELIGRTPAMLAAPGKVDMEKTFAYLQKTFQGKPQMFEWWGVRKNGEEFPKEVVLTRSHWFGQEVVLAIARDITERKQAEEAMARLAYISDSITDFVVVTDNEGKITYVNQAILSRFGYSKEELIGENAYVFLSRKNPRKLIQEVYENTRTGGWKGDLLIATKSGEEFWVSIKTAALKYKDSTLGMVAVSRDITERKLAEEALAAEKERLAVTLRSIGDGVITTNIQGQIVLMNPVAERLTGILQKDAIGKSLTKVFQLTDEKHKNVFINPVQTVIESGKIVEYSDYKLINQKTRKNRLVMVSASPIRNLKSEIIGVILVFQDVTEKRQMEQELWKAQKIESVGILAGGIAHDFNNILTAILGNISLAKMHSDSNQKLNKRLTEAEKATLRAKDLTQQLLTFSKGGTPVKETASIEELIRDSIDFSLRGSAVSCEVQIPKDLWPAEVDIGQMSRVIQNIVINAVQAMPNGGTVFVNAENIHIQDQMQLPVATGHYIKISIRDEGIGIPPEYLDKIFDPYFSTKEHGNGLGLAATYSIIKKHDGYIYAESRLGEGSTFHIYLPALPGKPLQKKQDSQGYFEGQGSVLIMDDESMVREVAQSILEDLGYQVATAPNGEEAIKMYLDALASGNKFDAVIMDLTIPGGMGGKEAVQKLLEIDPQVKAVVASGYSSDPIMSDHLNYGFKACIRKPFSVKELSKVLHEIISLSRQDA